MERTDEALANILQAINEKFPELAGKSMEYAVAYIQIDALTMLIGVVITVAVSAVLFTQSSKMEDEFFKPPLIMIGAFLGFIAFVMLMCAIPQYFATEGYLIYKMIGSVK